MLLMSKLVRQRVYVPRKPSRRDEKKGTEPEPKKLGRVHNLVFAPDGRTVVGVMVKRPDIAGMVKQEDRFLALDALELHEGGVLVTGGDDAFDKAACKRLNLDLAACYIWSGMDVQTASGKYLGYVMDARFNEQTGAVDCFSAQEGSAATTLVGSFQIPAAWLVRYEHGRMVVRDEASELELTGGLAGKAGEGYANAKEGAKRTAAKVDEAASAAVDKGSHALGNALGRAKATVKRSAADFREASGASSAKAVNAPGKSQAAGKATASGAGKAATRDAGKVAAKPTADKAARAVGEQLGKTKGMFSGFLREFKDASK